MKLSRRTVLRGAGGVAVTLPFLEAMRPRMARAAVARPCFIATLTPNGIIPQMWASGTENAFTLGTILAPFEPHKNDLLFLHGILKKGGDLGDNHQTGLGAFLTGRGLTTGSFPVGGQTYTVGWPSGISVDQYLGNEIAKTTKLKLQSLDLAVQALDSTIWTRWAYAAASQPISPENSPAAVYTRIFADLSTDPAQLAKLRADRASVLDLVLDQFNHIGTKVGTGDRQRLDAHATSIREVENGLSAISSGHMCTKPTRPTAPDYRANDNYPAIGKLQMDLMAMALACDLTRVATLLWAGCSTNTRMTWLGITEGHHELSHMQSAAGLTDLYSPTVANEKLLKISVWYAQQIAYLVGKLKSIQDDGGTLFDRTVLIWGNEISEGGHSLNNLPYVLGGGGWGAKMGRYLNYDSKTSLHNNILVSAANAMGLPTTTFGTPAWCSGPLPRLLG